MLEYRGYGKSSGSPSEPGKMAHLPVIHELLLKIKNLHIYLYFIATKYLRNNAPVE